MKYPQIGEEVRVKGETGLHKVINVAKWGGYPMVTLESGRKVWLTNVVTRYHKYITVYVIQQNFGDGWEDVTEEETRAAGIQARKDYRENTKYPTRLIRRKDLNPLYQK